MIERAVWLIAVGQASAIANEAGVGANNGALASETATDPGRGRVQGARSLMRSLRPRSRRQKKGNEQSEIAKRGYQAAPRHARDSSMKRCSCRC